jgi:hypothetical protein
VSQSLSWLQLLAHVAWQTPGPLEPVLFLLEHPNQVDATTSTATSAPGQVLEKLMKILP